MFCLGQDTLPQLTSLPVQQLRLKVSLTQVCGPEQLCRMKNLDLPELEEQRALQGKQTRALRLATVLPMRGGGEAHSHWIHSMLTLQLRLSLSQQGNMQRL